MRRKVRFRLNDLRGNIVGLFAQISLGFLLDFLEELSEAEVQVLQGAVFREKEVLIREVSHGLPVAMNLGEYLEEVPKEDFEQILFKSSESERVEHADESPNISVVEVLEDQEQSRLVDETLEDLHMERVAFIHSRLDVSFYFSKNFLDFVWVLHMSHLHEPDLSGLLVETCYLTT